jgi:tryptophan-rich sensory protein
MAAAGDLAREAVLQFWAVIGFGFSLTQTPNGQVIIRFAREADQGAVCAAQSKLSNVGWLVTCPLLGWIGAGVVAVVRLWPLNDPSAFEHSH